MKLILFSFSLLLLISFISAASIEDIESNVTNDDEIALSDTTNLLQSSSLMNVNQPNGELGTPLLSTRTEEAPTPWSQYKVPIISGVLCLGLTMFIIIDSDNRS